MKNETNIGNKPIHVCFVSLTAYPLFNSRVESIHGGSEVDIYMLATELAKDKNFTVSLVTSDYSQPEVEIIGGITIYKSTDLQTHPVAATLSMWKAMRMAKADIYFRKGASLVTVLVGLFCRLKGKPFFYRSSNTNHCDGTYIRQYWFRGRLYKWEIKQAAVVLVQNRTDVDSLRQSTGISSVFIPNGHYLNVVGEKKRDSILWVGRTAHVKRPELFVRLAKTFSSEKFVMICPRNTESDSYDELKLHRADNVEFYEQVPFAEIDNYFQRAKIFVNTSDSEGFPNTFIQACKCATPILSLNVNPDGFLDEYACGLCAKGNWDLFVKQVRILLNAQKQAEYGKNARRYVEENHNITSIAKQYKTMFVKLDKSRR